LFTDEELVTALQKLNSQAATGPQRIASRYLKQIFSNEQARVPLLLLMNSCLAQGRIPTSWGDAIVFILYKGKGDRGFPTNYRFISLSNDFIRIYERLLQERFNAWLRVEKPWGPMQFGFMPGVSTDDAFMCLRTLALTMTRHMRIPCYANFLDLRKAFPSIDRSATLRALHELGVPYELIRAFASTFSGNACRLVVNGDLTDPLLVNKGTKEGGINSPSIFNTAYASVLNKLDLKEYPDDESSIDPNAVYYLVFADDLVLISGNLSRLQDLTNQLQRELLKLGMTINGDKTKWMMFLPTDPLVVPSIDSLQLYLGDQPLEQIYEFVYLGFTITCEGSMDAHVKRREGLMLAAAASAGKLMRQLEVTNFKSLRAYFQSLVASQLYSHSVTSFSSSMYERAQKVFLQHALNLPPSFSIQLAVWLLDLEDLEVVLLRARFRYMKHVLSNPSAQAALKAMSMDRGVLLPHRVGWNSELFSAIHSLPELRDLDLTSLAGMDLALSDLSARVRERRLSQLRNSSLGYLVNFFSSGRIPRGFIDHLAQLPFESVRLLVLYFGNLTRFSMTRIPNPPCPLCSEILYSRHLFDCVRLEDFEDEQFSWRDLIHYYVNQDWMEGVTAIFRRFRRWSGISDIFRVAYRDNVDFYFQELQRMRYGTPSAIVPIGAMAGRGQPVRRS
jgi:hypothetical protein